MALAVLLQGAASGTSPPAGAALRSYDGDMAGIVMFGTGTSPTTGTLIRLSGWGWGGDDTYPHQSQTYLGPVIVLTPQNALTAALGILYVTNEGENSFDIGCTIAPAASQINTAYAIGFHCRLNQDG